MTKAKKEEVTEGEVRIAKWANGLRIVCNILKVFTMIGIVCLAVVLAFTPTMMKKVKISDEKIELFGQKIEYSFEEVDFLTYSIDGGDEHKVNTKDIYKYTGLLEIGKTNSQKVRNFLMVVMAFGIVMAVMEYIILSMLSKLLLRIRDEQKAFVEDGNKTIVNIMWISLAIEVTKMVSSTVASIFLASDAYKSTVSIDLMFVVVLCGMYFVSLLYKRGEELDK